MRAGFVTAWQPSLTVAGSPKELRILNSLPIPGTFRCELVYYVMMLRSNIFESAGTGCAAFCKQVCA